MSWIGGLIVGVFILGSLIGSAFSRQGENPETRESHADKLEYPPNENEKTSIATLARAHVAVAKDAYTAQKQNSTNAERTRRINFWTAVGVGVYTVFTAIIVVFNVVQYGETRRFSKNQLQILQGQLDTSRDTEERSLRAYVTIDSTSLTIDERAIVAVLRFKNTGQTPAYKFRKWDQLATRVAADKFARPPPLSKDVSLLSEGILGPQDTVTGEVFLPIENVMILQALVSSPPLAKIYVFGEAEYHDAFDTIWCFGFDFYGKRNRSGAWGLIKGAHGSEETKGTCQDYPN